MSDENKPLNADVGLVGAANATGVKDVESQTGKNQDASTSSADFSKAEIEEILGRRFPSKEEALKTLKNLNSLVGDQTIAEARKKAEAYNNLVKATAEQLGSTEEYADLYLQGKVPSVDNESSVVAPKGTDEIADFVARTKVSELELELQKERLLKKYPEAENVLGELVDLAKSRKASLLETYEKSSLKNLAKVLAAPAKDDSVVEPNSRIAPATDESDKLLARYKETGDENALQEAIKQRLYPDRE